MITWVTVWVLTVSTQWHLSGGAFDSKYQLQYATQEICEKQRKNHKGPYKYTRCDFQQIPMVKK